MNIEKPQPFKNKYGQINDSEVAHSMANAENGVRISSPDLSQKQIDKLHDKYGPLSAEQEYLDKQAQEVSEKITYKLTKEEKEFVEKNPILFLRNFLEKK